MPERTRRGYRYQRIGRRDEGCVALLIFMQILIPSFPDKSSKIVLPGDPIIDINIATRYYVRDRVN